MLFMNLRHRKLSKRLRMTSPNGTHRVLPNHRPLVKPKRADIGMATIGIKHNCLHFKEKNYRIVTEKPDITEEEFYASFGLKPPPEGFYYRVHADNTTVLDENGKPRLFSYYEPIFNVFTRIDFAPTPEQYAHYQKLVSELEAAYENKDDAEYARITAKIEAFKASAQGEIPDFTYSVIAPTSLYETEAYQNEIRRRAKEMRAKLYEEWGLGHLPAY